MKELKIKIFCWPILLVVILFPGWASAGSFSLSPAKQEIRLDSGSSTQASFAITNNLGHDSYFELKLKNIELDRAGVYPLADFINLESERVFVAEGQTKTIFFEVVVPETALPGGAYGYLQAVARPVRETEGEAGVSVALGSTVFVRVNGSIKEEGRLVSFGILGRRLKFTTPFEGHFSFENSGNIYLNPYGKMLLTNKLTGSQALEDIPPQSVLPGETRLFEIKINTLGFLGPYSATLLLNRGYNDEIDLGEVDFWFLPWPILMVIFIGLLFFILATLFKIIRKKNV